MRNQCHPPPTSQAETYLIPRQRVSSSSPAAVPEYMRTPEEKRKLKLAKKPITIPKPIAVVSAVVEPSLPPVLTAPADIAPAVLTQPPLRSYKKQPSYLQRLVDEFERDPIPVTYAAVPRAVDLNQPVIALQQSSTFYKCVNQSYTSPTRSRSCKLGSAADLEVRFAMSATTGEPCLDFIPSPGQSLGTVTFYHENIPGCLTIDSSTATSRFSSHDYPSTITVNEQRNHRPLHRISENPSPSSYLRAGPLPLLPGSDSYRKLP